MNIKTIELLGEQHPLCFSMTAAQNLTERFGSIQAMGEQLMSDDVSIRREAINDALTELLRAGRVYAKAKGDALPREITCKLADIMPPDTAAPVALIISVLTADTKREVEVENSRKNAEATLNK